MAPSLFEIIARTALVVLVNGLWQGAAIAGLTWLALRVFPRVNASTRYAAWTLALVAVFVVPIATSLSRISYYASPTSVAQPAAASAVKGTAPRSVLERETARVATQHRSTASGTTSRQSGGLRFPEVRALDVSVPFLIVAIFFVGWVLASLALVVRLVVALSRLEALKRDAMPLGIEYRDQLEQWQRLDARDRDVRICVTDGIEVPVAVGLFDSMVLLPQHLLSEFDAREIDQISLHELAHLLRHDDWSNGVQRVITALLFFNPAVWFIARQMDIEREVACDDYVLELTGAVRTYAFCLTKMAEMTSWPHQPLAAPGVFTTRKNISIRIERLLRTGRAIGSSISPATATLVALGLIAGYLVAFSLTPVVAFAMPAMPVAAVETAVPPAPPAARPALVQHVAAKPRAQVQVAQAEPTMAATAAAAPPKPAATARSRKRPVEAFTTKPFTVTVPATTVNVPQMSYTVPSIKVTMPHVRVAAANIHGGLDCTGCDFENQNLTRKNFSGSNLAGTDFSHANLQGATFDGSNLNGADFEGADLRNASFDGANLTGANLDGAKLDGVKFEGANLDGVNLNVRALSQAQIRAYLPHCNGCDLHGADLSGMDLHGIKLTGVDFSHSNLRGANLRNAVFSGVDFSGADLRGANTDGTKFIGCDFSGALLSGP